MKILWEEQAWEEYLEWQTQDKKTLKRINMLIRDIQRDCYEGIGKPEPLKNNLRGFPEAMIINGQANVLRSEGVKVLTICK